MFTTDSGYIWLSYFEVELVSIETVIRLIKSSIKVFLQRS